MQFNLIHKFFLSRVKFVFLLAALVFSAFKPGIESNEGNEYEVKAMFVLNFIRYVEWPEKNTNTEFSIGIIGESEMAAPLERIAVQKKVGDKKIIIRKLSAEDDTYCNIILVSRERAGKLELIEKKYAGKGVLIISDESPHSAAINLVKRDNKIRFEINQAAAKSGGVKISGQLLQLAITVH